MIFWIFRVFQGVKPGAFTVFTRSADFIHFRDQPGPVGNALAGPEAVELFGVFCSGNDFVIRFRLVFIAGELRVGLAGQGDYGALAGGEEEEGQYALAIVRHWVVFFLISSITSPPNFIPGASPSGDNRK